MKFNACLCVLMPVYVYSCICISFHRLEYATVFGNAVVVQMVTNDDNVQHQ